MICMMHISTPDRWETKFSWEREDFGDEYPSLGGQITACRTLARGGMQPVKLSNHRWSETSDHLYLNMLGADSFWVPARIVGRMLVWLVEQANPPRRPWWEVEFWICRTEDDEWTWFMDDSPEATGRLPWRHKTGEEAMQHVMES